MQIHTEARLVWNINTSISEFAMKMAPPSTSYRSLLFSCGQHRMGESGTKSVTSLRHLNSTYDEGGSALVGIQKLIPLENGV